MDKLEKDRLIAEISTGIIIIKFGGEKYYIHPPSPLLIQESFNYIADLKEEMLYEDLLSTDDVRSYLMYYGMLPADLDTQIDKLNKQEEELKFQAYVNRLNPAKVNMIKTSLRAMSKKAVTLLTGKHSLDHLTMDGYIEQCRQNYIITRSVKNTYGIIINIDDNAVLCDYISQHISFAILSADVLRELARTDPWRSILNAAGGEYLFDTSPMSMTLNQKHLIYYSRMYDNIYKHQDCPDNTIIEDDILLDGWLIAQQRKMEEERRKSDGEQYGKGDEIFLVPESKEHLQKIQQLNSADGSRVKTQRFAEIKQKGKVKEQDLSEKKQEIQFAAMQAFSSKIKGT